MLRFTQTQVGDMFIVRNAGNMVPHSSLVSPTAVATEPAVLELACVLNSVSLSNFLIIENYDL